MTDAEQPSHQPDTCPCTLCQAIRELVRERDDWRATALDAVSQREHATARAETAGLDLKAARNALADLGRKLAREHDLYVQLERQLHRLQCGDEIESDRLCDASLKIQVELDAARARADKAEQNLARYKEAATDALHKDMDAILHRHSEDTFENRLQRECTERMHHEAELEHQVRTLRARVNHLEQATVKAEDLWAIYARAISRSADWQDAMPWERRMLEEMATLVNTPKETPAP